MFMIILFIGFFFIAALVAWQGLWALLNGQEYLETMDRLNEATSSRSSNT